MVIGADPDDLSELLLGHEVIKHADSGKLLGVVINGSGIDSLGHVKDRYDMVKAAISQIKSCVPMGCQLIKHTRSFSRRRFYPVFHLLLRFCISPVGVRFRILFVRSLIRLFKEYADGSFRQEQS